MFYTLVKIGKIPWIQNVMPILNISLGLGYGLYHHSGHPILRRLFTAENPDGSKEYISDHMRNLIKDVYLECIPHIYEQYLRKEESKSPPIQWFCSSSLDPISLGATWLFTSPGMLIGMPLRYNYKSVEELPKTFFELSEMHLFKKPQKKSKTDDESNKNLTQVEALKDEVVLDLEASRQNVTITKIDRDDPEANNYSESLILSEEAKKFSIAREILACDSYRVVAKIIAIVSSGTLAICLSRGAVMKIPSFSNNIQRRLPLYGLAGLIGGLNCTMLNQSAENYFSTKADNRALALGPKYQDGAIEYYTKILTRNKALRRLTPDGEFKFDEEGNPKSSVLLSALRMTITKHLEDVKNYKFGKK